MAKKSVLDGLSKQTIASARQRAKESLHEDRSDRSKRAAATRERNKAAKREAELLELVSKIRKASDAEAVKLLKAFIDKQ